MQKVSIILLVIFTSCLASDVYAKGSIDDFLFDLGKQYYKQGNYKQALNEIDKALVLNPGYQEYLDLRATIQSELPAGIKIAEKPKENLSLLQPQKDINVAKRQGEIDKILAELESTENKKNQEAAKKITTDEKEVIPEPEEQLNPFNEKIDKTDNDIPVAITGELVIKGGFTSEDTIGKKANFDLNERNWRMLSDNALNHQENTYNPGIYDRVRFNLDTENDSGFNFHSNITVDPWSYTGKSDTISLTGSGGDSAIFEIYYWSNSGYTVNNTIYTLNNGDSFALPEIKLKDGKIDSTIITSSFLNTFSIPETEIDMTFMPLRELWVGYNTDETFSAKIFPMAYENQAFSSDDPFGLSNHRNWWEASPWLERWRAGIYNSGATPADFTKGGWDNALSSFTRDSDGTRLTALRGASFNWLPWDGGSLSGTFATPKGLWDDYSDIDSINSAIRFKQQLADNFSFGTIYTSRLGYTGNDIEEVDAINHVGAVDMAFAPADSIKLEAEVASSRSAQDIKSDYKTNKRGDAIYFSAITSSARDNMLSQTYYSLRPEKSDDLFYKVRFNYAYMGDGFDPALANYRETRSDAYWSRHINFRKPFEFYSLGLSSTGLTWDDMEPFRLGDSIDIGRFVLGLRAEVDMLDGRLHGLGDIRNAHYTNGKYVENVSRTEWTYKITPKLTSKLLLLNHDLPKTIGGKDPFVFDSETGIYLNNTAIEDGKDPSLNTGSLGMEYEFTDWLAVNSVWEHTNDFTVATDNFPRGILNSSSFTTYSENGLTYRRVDPFLYSQGFYPLPPYHYYDIFKGGIRLRPIDKLEVYLDGTRNEFEHSGQIDGNMNHIGIEISYLPIRKFGMLFKYDYSLWNDINKLNSGVEPIYDKHHNFFTQLRYQRTDSEELSIEYGVGGYSTIGSSTTDPFGDSMSVLDTQHIFRLSYRKRF